MNYHINCILIQDNFWVERQIQKSGRRKKEKKILFSSVNTYSNNSTSKNSEKKIASAKWFKSPSKFCGLFLKTRHVCESEESLVLVLNAGTSKGSIIGGMQNISVKAEWNLSCIFLWNQWDQTGQYIYKKSMPTKKKKIIIRFHTLLMNIRQFRNNVLFFMFINKITWNNLNRNLCIIFCTC